MNITHESNQLDDLLMEDFNKKDEELNKYYKGFSYKSYYSSDLTWYQKLWDWWCKLWS